MSQKVDLAEKLSQFYLRLHGTDFLLVDIGNTRLKWACVGPNTGRGDELVVGKPLAPHKSVIRALAARHPMHWVVVASVVPDLNPEIQRAFSLQPLLEVSGTCPFLGYTFTYPHPPELGADRLADAAALFHYGKFPAVSVNCGTATVLNVLDAQGRFMGGVIQPGLELIREALPSRAAGLRRFKGREFELSSLSNQKIGQSTGEALESGTLSAFRGGVTEALRQVEEALAAKPKVYLTGGNAQFLGLIAENVETKALLTLTGLNIIAERWRSRS